MANPKTYEFYKAYVINVKEFCIAETELRRTINRALKDGKELTSRVQTKIYALLYSTFSEANFMKMILTPYGFKQEHINKILEQGSIREKWSKCLDFAFLDFNKKAKGSEIPNKCKELHNIIDKFIIEPSIIRNKIAHGQLVIALNSKQTSLNPDITYQLQSIDCIAVYRWFNINQRLCSIIEDLIESPDKAHYNYYYCKYQELEDFISRTENWTIESKMKTSSMMKPRVGN